MAPDLPTDILENILSRLPVKSLLRFKTVCRSWNAIISHPGFVMNSDSQNLFFLVFGYVQLFVFRLDDHDGKFDAEGPFRRRNESTRIMCIADGIVLLRGQGYPKGNWTYALWNPSTRKEAALPKFPYEFHQNTIHGLCHDPRNNDFKVVIGFRLSTCSKSSSSVFYSVFSCKEGSWTEKRDFPFSFPLPSFKEVLYDGDVYDSAGLSVDGAIYWIFGGEHGTSNATQYITYFDPGDNSLKILQKPENDLGECNATRIVTYYDFIDKSFKNLQKKPEDDLFYLAVFKGRLYLCCCDRDDMVRIWLKEKDSWKMLISFDDTGRIWLMERGCWKMSINIDNVANEELQILIRLREGRYVIYNHCDKTCNNFGRYEFDLKKLYPYGATMFFPPLAKTERKRRVLN